MQRIPAFSPIYLPLALLVTTTSLTLGLRSGMAQVSFEESEVETDEVVEVEESEAAPEPSTPKADEAKKEEKPVEKKPTPQEIAQQLMRSRVQRTPTAMLKAVSGLEFSTGGNKSRNGNRNGNDNEGNGGNSEPSGASEQAKEFTKSVLTGDWPAIGRILKSLPEKEARQVFTYLAQQLQQPLQQQRQLRQNQGKPEFGVVLPTEVLELAECLGHELKEPEQKAIGNLLERAISQDFPKGPLLERLRTGSGIFGGTDQAKRMNAARLLVQAQLPREAAEFVLPLPEAREKKDAESLLIHSQATLAQAQDDNSDAGKLASWNLVLEVLDMPDAPLEMQSLALQQILSLMEEVPAQARKEFLKDLVEGQSRIAHALVAAAAERQGGMAHQGDTNQRNQGLRLLKEMADLALKDSDEETKKGWTPVLNRMALPWLDEAITLDLSKNQRQNEGGYYDEYGNFIRSGSRVVYRNGQRVVEDQSARQVDPVALLELAPDEAWISVLEPNTRQRLVNTLPKVALAADDNRPIVDLLKAMAKNDPKATAGLVAQYLSDWGQKRNPTQHFMRNRYARYYGNGMYYNPYGQQQQGIPITRALQERNVSELATLLEQIRQLPIPQPDPDVLANTFAAMHSAAEVFTATDIEKVFGKVDKMDSRVLTPLIDTMRERLASVWRNKKTQDQERTKRTEKEMNAEVQRGYDVAMGLANGALGANPNEHRFHMIRAALAFDWAEFKYGQKEDLKNYTEKRDEAFNGFIKAAEVYASKVKDLKPKDYDISPYGFWFNATLGASDLSYVTRQQVPSKKRLEAIKTAIEQLPGEAGKKHLDLLAENLNGAVQSLQAHLKQPYVDAMLTVLGSSHPKAREGLDLQRFYGEVASEVEFVANVDGPTAVGQKPFGLVYSLRYTQAVGREADGFRKFLTNQTQNNYYSYPGMPQQPPQDYRDQFEKQVNTTLGENFEVLGLTFADVKEPNRHYGRDGWMETAYAYVLLKAKQPTVDLIPSVKLDLDFSDQYGQVLLPKTTTTLAIDSRDAAARPVQELAITQTLDQRDSAKGQFTLEVKAKGAGVIPPLADLLDVNLAGLKVKDINDPGISLNKLVSNDAGLAAEAERSWIVSLELAGPERPTSISFPKVKLPAKVSLKRFEDADLVDAAETVPVAALPKQSFKDWVKANQKEAILYGGGGLAGLILLGLLIRWASRPRAYVAPRYKMPTNPTPFNVLSLLRDLHGDVQVKLPDARRLELHSTIQELEQSYFSPTPAPKTESELQNMAQQWLRAARLA
jgi:hypothetical protein